MKTPTHQPGQPPGLREALARAGASAARAHADLLVLVDAVAATPKQALRALPRDTRPQDLIGDARALAHWTLRMAERADLALSGGRAKRQRRGKRKATR